MAISEVGRVLDGVPVVHRGRELYRLKSGLGSITAESRARAVEKRLDEIVADTTIAPADIVARHGEQYSEIVAKGTLIGIITDSDGQANGESRRLVAEAVALALRRVIADTRLEFSPGHVRSAVLQASVITLVLVVVFFAVHRLLRVIRRVVDQHSVQRIESLHIQSAEIVSAERLRTFLLSLIDWGRIVFYVVGVLVWIESVLSALPWTRPAAEQILGWATAPAVSLRDAGVAFLPNVFFLGTIALATWLALAAGRFVFGQVARGRIRAARFRSGLGRARRTASAASCSSRSRSSRRSRTCPGRSRRPSRA